MIDRVVPAWAWSSGRGVMMEMRNFLSRFGFIMGKKGILNSNLLVITFLTFFLSQQWPQKAAMSLTTELS